MLHKTNPNFNKTNNINYLLRKTKSFNKSRYSRNRQYYRTGVFLCLWANIILVLGAYYVTFRLTFRFGYIVLLMLGLFNLVLFSYFSRNLTYGFFRLVINFLNTISLNLLTALSKAQLVISLYLNSYPISFLRQLLNTYAKKIYRFWV